jgi:hypothetical protein
MDTKQRKKGTRREKEREGREEEREREEGAIFKSSWIYQLTDEHS